MNSMKRRGFLQFLGVSALLPTMKVEPKFKRVRAKGEPMFKVGDIVTYNKVGRNGLRGGEPYYNERYYNCLGVKMIIETISSNGGYSYSVREFDKPIPFSAWHDEDTLKMHTHVEVLHGVVE